MIDFVCFSQNNWEKRKARKQQFMFYLSQREDVDKVLYIEPPLNFFRLLILPFLELKNLEDRLRWRRALKLEVEPLSDKFFLYTPLFFLPFSFRIQFIYNLNLFLCLQIIKIKLKNRKFKNIVLWLYHPYDYKLLDYFKKRFILCFDWAEEWSKYFWELSKLRRQKIKKLQEKIILKADLVFVVSENLLKEAKKINPYTFLLLDATSPELFQKETKIPKDLLGIKRPIIGYSGTIDERIDIELIKFICENLANASFVFIGNILSKRIDITDLKNLKNVYFLGAKSYKELPAYIKEFDVCISPRKVDAYIPPPTKIFDYLASKKPIVSTASVGIKDFGNCIKIANNKEEFLNFIKEALKEDRDELKQLRFKKAQENSWAIRAEEIIEKINNFKKQKIKKILIIPPHYVAPQKMKIRLIEVAQCLSSKYKVYLLSWQATLSMNFLKRAFSCILDLFKIPKIYRSQKLTHIEFPILHRPLLIALKFNSYFLKRFIQKENIDLVISGSYYMFSIPKERNYKYILDLADLPAFGNNYFDRFIYQQTKQEAKKADTITVISYGLSKYILENYQRNAYIVPNGAYINRLRSFNPYELEKLREKYGLINKYVIGYIGFIGDWVKIEFLADVFYQLKKELPNLCLFIVGACPKLKLLKRKFLKEEIIFTGTIEEDISNYFNLLDIGLLPHEKNLFQDLAFHIKLIEYTAARKMVVATPLEEIKRLNFPNILLADLEIKLWVEAIKKAKNMKWQKHWDSLVDNYDWSIISQKFIDLIGIQDA